MLITDADFVLYGNDVFKLSQETKEMINVVLNDKKLIRYLKYFDVQENILKSVKSVLDINTIFDRYAKKYTHFGTIAELDTNFNYFYCILPCETMYGAIIIANFEINNDDRKKHGFFRYAKTVYKELNDLLNKMNA